MTRYLPVSILYNFIQHFISIVLAFKFGIIQAIDSSSSISIYSLGIFFTLIWTHIKHRNDLLRLNLLNSHNTYIHLSNISWLKRDNISYRRCCYIDGRVTSVQRSTTPKYMTPSSTTIEEVWKLAVTKIPEFLFNDTVLVDVTGGCGLLGILTLTYSFAAASLLEKDFKTAAFLKHNIHTFVTENVTQIKTKQCYVQNFEVGSINTCTSTVLLLINDINIDVTEMASYYVKMATELKKFFHFSKRKFKRFYIIYVVDDPHCYKQQDLFRSLETEMDMSITVTHTSIAPSLLLGVQNKIFLSKIEPSFESKQGL